MIIAFFQVIKEKDSVNKWFTPLRGVNARVDYVERLVPAASRREPVVRPAEPPV